MEIIIPIITLFAGVIGGFFAGVYFVRGQMNKMQNNPELIQKMAKQMGMNMNKQQMSRVQQMMKQNKSK